MNSLALDVRTALSARYQVEQEIGAGAVSVVFLARDRKHGRRVAIKVLRPELSAGISPARFQREIAIAASLHHPHILPLFDSGEADGALYFTMPYVEGETLRNAVERGPLAIPAAMLIARQVASALSYAHARGVLHRDVKPENILMADGVPQLADFGVACVFPSDRGERLTQSGVAVGTAAYMSPEQWSGGPVDERSDLYSLGCVLYEMIAGSPPFSGPTTQAIMARHVLDPVPPMRSVRPTVSRRLESAVERALAKVPGDRLASLAEFAAELAEIDVEERTRAGGGRGGNGSPSRHRGTRDAPGILVLPFVNLSATDQDFIGSGLTDEIITSLSGLEALRVISHTSAAQLKGTTRTTRALGHDLNVTYVLEGSVRMFGDTLRVAARLVATETEDLVWGDSYQGSMAGLLELEKSISRSVVDALAVRLSAREQKRLTEHRIADTRAYEYYVRARQEIYKFTGEALDRALDYLRKGLELCGDNVAIWAALGQVYWQYVNAGISSDTTYFEKARECADRIREIDPDSPEARRLLGLLEINARGDPQVAVDHLKASLDGNPNDPESLFWLSILYGFVGRPSTGYALAIRLLDIDPLTPLHHLVPGFLDVLDGDPERGIPWLARAHELEPGNPITSIAYGQALAMAGSNDSAADVLRGIQEHVPDSFFAQFGRAFAAAVQSRQDEAREALTPEVLENASHDLQYSWTLSQYHVLLGDQDEACRWAENAVRHGFWNFPLLAERDALLAPLREHPRYAVLMSEIKSKWLEFRA